jgi:hypothetical protein
MSYTQDIYMSRGTEYNRHAQHCNVVALYIDGCLGFHDILVYWNENTLYNFRTNCYVQCKTYTTITATVHLNCSTVSCNTLCARIAAAVWRKTRDVICDLQSARPWDAVPWCKTYPCQIKFIIFFIKSCVKICNATSTFIIPSLARLHVFSFTLQPVDWFTFILLSYPRSWRLNVYNESLFCLIIKFCIYKILFLTNWYDMIYLTAIG